MPNLIPQRDAIPFQAAWPTDSQPLFDSAVVDERGVFVTGCGSAVAVFQIFNRARAWFTIKAQTKITGFAVSSSSLYVQDGPVISGWDLTYGTCFRGYNIVTKQEWKPPQSENPCAVAEVPPSLYHVPPTAANDTVVFSPPVVRESQIQGEFSGQVFVLGSDGSIHGFDDSLKSVATAKFRAPLRPELTMAELPQQSGDVLCRLHYIATDGAIVAINASTSPLAEVAGWATKGAPVAAKVLPLRFIDGLLWGGGILGADFFAMPPDPTRSMRLIVPAKNAWRAYEVSVDEKLVVVTDGKVSRLLAYDEGAKQRDRWGERTASKSCYSGFWPGIGGDPTTRGPTLVLEVDDELMSTSVAFRVVLANTVDSVDPAFTSTYPPASTQLDSATFGPGSFPTLRAISLIRGKPVISRHTMYCVARGSANGPDAVVMFALAAERSAVLPQAAATLADLRQRAQPLRIHVARMHRYHVFTLERKDGPYNAANVAFKLKMTPGGEAATHTDGQGFAFVDPKFIGAAATLVPEPPVWVTYGEVPARVTSTTPVLSATEANGLWVDVHFEMVGWSSVPDRAPVSGRNPFSP